MKARQLREKFAGRSTASNGGGASGGGGGGGGTKYVGYGNSDAAWNSSGASKGYGESGIGAGRDPTNSGYAGRYGDGGVNSARPNATVASDVKKSSSGKVKKVKKKKPEAAAPGEFLSFV